MCPRKGKDEVVVLFVIRRRGKGMRELKDADDQNREP